MEDALDGLRQNVDCKKSINLPYVILLLFFVSLCVWSLCQQIVAVNLTARHELPSTIYRSADRHVTQTWSSCAPPLHDVTLESSRRSSGPLSLKSRGDMRVP